jgi:hypothetical protein
MNHELILYTQLREMVRQVGETMKGRHFNDYPLGEVLSESLQALRDYENKMNKGPGLFEIYRRDTGEVLFTGDYAGWRQCVMAYQKWCSGGGETEERIDWSLCNCRSVIWPMPEGE